jgi:hypothetical protein
LGRFLSARSNLVQVVEHGPLGLIRISVDKSVDYRLLLRHSTGRIRTTRIQMVASVETGTQRRGFTRRISQRPTDWLYPDPAAIEFVAHISARIRQHFRRFSVADFTHIRCGRAMTGVTEPRG